LPLRRVTDGGAVGALEHGVAAVERRLWRHRGDARGQPGYVGARLADAGEGGAAGPFADALDLSGPARELSDRLGDGGARTQPVEPVLLGVEASGDAAAGPQLKDPHALLLLRDIGHDELRGVGRRRPPD